MDTQKHNGWTNYATWRVASELDNDEQAYHAAIKAIEYGDSLKEVHARYFFQDDLDLGQVNWTEIELGISSSLV